jgi:hypothetical protein
MGHGPKMQNSMGANQGAQNSEKTKRFLEETRECPGHATQKGEGQNQLLPVPLQMKPFNKLWPALMESKLAIALLAGLFVGAVVLFSVPPQFSVHGGNGEPLWRIAKLVTCDVWPGWLALAISLTALF